MDYLLLHTRKEKATISLAIGYDGLNRYSPHSFRKNSDIWGENNRIRGSYDYYYYWKDLVDRDENKNDVFDNCWNPIANLRPSESRFSKLNLSTWFLKNWQLGVWIKTDHETSLSMSRYSYRDHRAHSIFYKPENKAVIPSHYIRIWSAPIPNEVLNTKRPRSYLYLSFYIHLLFWEQIELTGRNEEDLPQALKDVIEQGILHYYLDTGILFCSATQLRAVSFGFGYSSYFYWEALDKPTTTVAIVVASMLGTSFELRGDGRSFQSILFRFHWPQRSGMGDSKFCWAVSFSLLWIYLRDEMGTNVSTVSGWFLNWDLFVLYWRNNPIHSTNSIRSVLLKNETNKESTKEPAHEILPCCFWSGNFVRSCSLFFLIILILILLLFLLLELLLIQILILIVLWSSQQKSFPFACFNWKGVRMISNW